MAVALVRIIWADPTLNVALEVAEPCGPHHRPRKSGTGHPYKSQGLHATMPQALAAPFVLGSPGLHSSRECTRSPVLAAMEIRGISCEVWKPFHSGALSSNSCGSTAVGQAGLRGGESPAPRPAACALPLPGCAAPPADRSPSSLRRGSGPSADTDNKGRNGWVSTEKAVGPASTGFQGF